MKNSFLDCSENDFLKRSFQLINGKVFP